MIPSEVLNNNRKIKKKETVYSSSSQDDPDAEPIVKYIEEEDWNEEGFIKSKSSFEIKQELEDKLKLVKEEQMWVLNAIMPDLLKAQIREVKKYQKCRTDEEMEI
jgi:hypothetical protein